ncbi:hypothetical protein FRB91_009229 [Serendipita sp. 411]|nr:hypothetical protein FRC15_010826 [Serendipita sp. 397]KAG8797136.1 hypothetical protein FRC16_009186 [Serendipita sp. 398]KAG8861318.1 hypothetical protein FRB91_009229 [Serendipita sp. 411]KAG8864183.1 hypothetical protein FRC20_010321 [Serendipita sp. 405]
MYMLGIDDCGRVQGVLSELGQGRIGDEMLKPRQSVCNLRRGRTVPHILQQSRHRLLSTASQKHIEPTIGPGPFPDPQIGDYPQPEGVSNQMKDPKGWWDTQYRRNFGETLHEQDEVLNMFSPDLPHANIHPRTALAQASIAFTIIGGIMVFLGYNAPQMPATRRAFPRDGLVDELGGWQQNKANPESLEEH